jgi:hypothetical protein
MNEPSWMQSAVDVAVPALALILLILGAFTAGITAMILKARHNERLHKERIHLMEKGLDVPQALYGVTQKRIRDYRTTRVVLLITGWFMLAMGPFILIGIGVQEGFREAAPAFSTFGIGAGLLIAERMIGGRFPKNGGNGHAA